MCYLQMLLPLLHLRPSATSTQPARLAAKHILLLLSPSTSARPRYYRHGLAEDGHERLGARLAL
jgi:hypothetical protein